LVAVSVTVYDPADAYSWLGCCCVEVAPSPNSQSQLVGPPRDRSVKDTECGAVPVAGDPAKSAVGSVASPVSTTSCGEFTPSRLE
jgi:hypothetical protein